MAKVLVLYYSAYGHIETMAYAVAEGARSAGADVTVKRVPELVPDDVILGMVKNRIQKEDCKNGFLFDGFPRTIAQAEALEEISAIDYVINLDVPAERLISRISGRRMCAECGAGYHVSTYADANCKCGAALYQREDDKEETVRNRLVVYERSTKPLIEYYTRKGLLHTVNGDASIDIVDAAIRAVLSK